MTPARRSRCGAASGKVASALWWLGDSYRLVLAGESDAHGQLWSEAFATLARAHGPRLPWLASDDPRPQQRVVLCGLAEGASVEAADGSRTPLLIEAAASARHCAAYWPGAAGWQLLRSGGATLPFHVRAEDEAPGLLAQATREATAQLVVAGGECDRADPDSRAGTTLAVVPRLAAGQRAVVVAGAPLVARQPLSSGVIWSR